MMLSKSGNAAAGVVRTIFIQVHSAELDSNFIMETKDENMSASKI